MGKWRGRKEGGREGKEEVKTERDREGYTQHQIHTHQQPRSSCLVLPTLGYLHNISIRSQHPLEFV